MQTKELVCTHGELKSCGDDLFLNKYGELFQLVRFPDGSAELQQLSVAFRPGG